jgi:hypothetical protein
MLVLSYGKFGDTAELGIDYDPTLLSFGSSSEIQIGDMTFVNVEMFLFSGGENYTFEQLQDLEPINV